MKIRPAGTQVIHADRETDRGTNMMELKGAFRDHANVSKQKCIHEHKNHYTGNDTVISANSINIPNGQALSVKARYCLSCFRCQYFAVDYCSDHLNILCRPSIFHPSISLLRFIFPLNQ
jgi:hypothetical protein